MPYKDVTRLREYQRNWMRNRRREALAGKTCLFCGSSERLEIHHWDPFEKVDHKVWSWSARRREAELAKCVVLCHDCHVGKHREMRPTHCGRGHEFTPENTYVKPSTGYRECLTCKRERARRWRAA